MSGGFMGQRGGFTHWQYLPLSGGTVVGAVTFSAAVTLSSTLAVTGAMTLESTLVQTKDTIGTGATAGYTLRNTIDAAAGAQQYSPMLVLTGEGWKTDATAATQVWNWAIQNRPVEGAAASTSALHFLSQVDGGGYTSRASIRSDGRFDVSATGIAFYASAGQIRSDVSGTAFNALNGGMYVSAAVGYDAGNAAVLKIGPTNATGVQVGKSGGTVGLYAATPVARAATIADADGTLADITTKFNTLLVACENIGILLTA